MDDDRFVRSFNRRRLFAKLSIAAVAVLLVLHHFGPRSGRWSGIAGSAAVYFGVLGLVAVFNGLRGRCPACGRFIGVAGLLRVPRRAPCGLESRLLERLDWPDA